MWVGVGMWAELEGLSVRDMVTTATKITATKSTAAAATKIFRNFAAKIVFIVTGRRRVTAAISRAGA